MRPLPFLALLLISPDPVAAARTVRVSGTVANVDSWEFKGHFTAMVAGSMGLPRPGVVSTRPQLMVDLKTGTFAGELECEVIRNAHGRWVDIHFVGMSHLFREYPEMVIRAPYSTTIDLGRIDWRQSNYRWKEGALVIDTAVPRDTLIGDRSGNHMRISPINPEPGDSMRFEFVWENSGQPHVASMGGFYMKDCCTILCDFTFAERTDTDVYGESWPHHARPFVLAELAPGRYRLQQTPATGMNLRDVDFLLNRDLFFNVSERHEP